MVYFTLPKDIKLLQILATEAVVGEKIFTIFAIFGLDV